MKNRRFIFIIRFYFFNLVLFSLWRLAFYFIFHSAAENYSLAELLHALNVGFRFDLRLVSLLAAPALVLPLFRVLHWSTGPIRKKIWLGYFTLMYFIFGLIYVGDLGYYSYLNGRVNFSIFDFLNNFETSMGMLWESYNILGWLLFLLLWTTFCWWMIRWLLNSDVLAPSPAGSLSISKKAAIGFLSVFLFALSIHGRLNQYPLRWSDAFSSRNTFISSLGLNPILYIYDTAEYAEKDYNEALAKKYSVAVRKYLNMPEQNSPPENSLSYKRDLNLTPIFGGRPNVVYIVMESMAAFKTGVFGNAAGASPALDELANKGWLFNNYYVPSEGTARSMYCILTGIPDMNFKSTSSRNPLIIDQHSPINGFKDYEKFYFIGGSASWGNIRGIFENNIQNIKILEGDSSKGPRTDVWGLSDLDLFRQAASTLRQASEEKKPFFAIIQSSSFHRPFTIPEEHGTFELKDLPPEELKKFGFGSLEEFNSFRFADYSLGEFFRLIKNDKFFENTIFIIQGDHGMPHNEAAHLPEGYKFFGINRYHTPLVIYSPLIKEPKRFSYMMSEPDVLPTVLSITGLPYKLTTMGRNIFSLYNNPEAKKDPIDEMKDDHYVFSYVYYARPLQVMLYNGQYLLFGHEGQPKSLHLYKSAEPDKDLKALYPEKFKEMSDLYMGLFENSRYMLYHNPKIVGED